MMTQSLPSIDRFIIHRGTMLLLDRVLEANDDFAVSEVLIKSVSPFWREGRGVPAYVGLEYMAQTIAALDGGRRLKTGEEPSIGFLLGTRRYQSKVGYFVEGQRLQVRAKIAFSDGGMAAFDCIIGSGGEELVSASLNVYRPENGEMETGEDQA